MPITTTSPLTMLLILLLTTLSLAATIQPLHPRQDASATSPSPDCAAYTLTASLATVGSNSTYRTSYLQLSPLGTLTNQKKFSAAMLALPALTADRGLNSACGNQTEQAAAEVAARFLEGRVLELDGVNGLDSPPGKIVGSGMDLLAIVGLVLIMTVGVWSQV